MSRTGAAFSRAATRLGAHFGDEAVLRAGEPVVAIISEGVELIGEYGQVAQLVTTATLMAATAPHTGDALTVGATAWIIDSILRGDGITVECVVRKVTP